MTTHDRDKVIAAAKEADFTDKQWEVMTYETGPYDITEATTELGRFYAIGFEDGRQAEREECAEVCEALGSDYKGRFGEDDSLFLSSSECADAIRARSRK